jgi:hypothetical protein
MKYEKQITLAMERLDQALFTLRDLIKRGQNKEAIQFMEEGQLKERYDELQNLITLSSTNPLGASGISSTQPL